MWHPRLGVDRPRWWRLPTSSQAKSASRALVPYGSMVADDIVVLSRVATLIGALDAALIALSNCPRKGQRASGVTEYLGGAVGTRAQATAQLFLAAQYTLCEHTPNARLGLITSD